MVDAQPGADDVISLVPARIEHRLDDVLIERIFLRVALDAEIDAIA